MVEISVIKAFDLSEAWYLCVQQAWFGGREYLIQKGSFEGTRRREIPFVVVNVYRPDIRPLAPFVPEGVIPPTNDQAIEDYFVGLLEPEKAPNQDYTYGQCLAPQVPEVIRRYKQWGYDTNRLCMSVGSKDSLFEYRKEEETGQQASSQCLRLVDTRIQDNKLHFAVYFRSWDLWSGFPVNLGGLQLLKEYMALEIGVEDGQMIAISKGLHLYEHVWALVRILLREGE